MVKVQLVLMLVLVAVASSTSSHARTLIGLVDIFSYRHYHSTTSTSIPNPPFLNSEISNFSPYRECIQSCKSCACTQVWPPDLSLCVCLDPGKVKGKIVPIPYKDCKQSCESACACTLVYPPELSQCICLDPSQPVHDNAIGFHNHNYELSSGNDKGSQPRTVY